MQTRSRSLPLWLLAPLWLGVAPGCLAPENSPLFEVDWPAATREAVADSTAHAQKQPELPRFSANQTLGVSPPASYTADGELTLSLGRALLMTLAANRELAVSASSPAIAIALEQVRRGEFDPEAFGSLQFGQSSVTETSRATGEGFTVEGDDIRTVAGLRQFLPTGTEIELSVDQRRTSSDRAPEQQDARVGLSLTQQLLQGAGSAANLVQLRQAGLDIAASQHELRGFTSRVIADAERAWWLYRLAEQRLALFERALAVANRQTEVARRRIAVQVLAEAAGAAAEAEAALRRQDLIDARSLAETRRLRLLRVLGGPSGNLSPGSAADASVAERDWLTQAVTTRGDGEEGRFDSTDRGPDPDPVNDLETRVDLSVQLRPELAEARIRLEQDRLETVLTRNGILPRLEVFLELGKAGFDDTFVGSFEDLDSESFDLSTGFRFVAPLGNDTARGRDLAASASRAQSAAAVSNLTQLVRLEVREAAVELERARQQISASRATLAFQKQVAAGEQQRFEAGEATSLDAALAARDLVAAEVAVLTSRIEYRLALIDLHLAEGSLLARRGIAIDPGHEGTPFSAGVQPR